MACLALVLFAHVVLSSANDLVGPFRRIFDASQAMMTGRPDAKFPDNHFNTLLGCLSISPDLIKAQDHAWDGFVEYYAANRNDTGSDPWGKAPVPWHESYNNRDWGNYTGGSVLQHMDYNTSFPSIPIYEPCNFVSNFAFYRVAPEVCHRASTQSMTAASRQGFVESLAILGFGSAFFHGSDTYLGGDFDVTMIQVLAFVAHQVVVEHLETEGTPWILRDLSAVHLNRSATGISRKLTEGLMKAPPSQWASLLPKSDISPTSPKDLPDFEFVFAGIVSAIMSAALPSTLTRKLTPFLMGLFHMPADQQSFILDTYIPLVEKSLRQVPVPLTLADRIAILRKLVAFCMKILFAFAFQESYFPVELLLRRDVNVLGGLLVPALNVLADVLSGEIWWESLIPLGINVYPGDEKCRLRQPHAKWHEMAANAFLELLYMADKMNEVTSPHAATAPASDLADDAALFVESEVRLFAKRARAMISSASGRAAVDAFVDEVDRVFRTLDADANGIVTYNEFVQILKELIARDELHLSAPEGFVERLLRSAARNHEIIV